MTSERLQALAAASIPPQLHSRPFNGSSLEHLDEMLM
jgi:hypothetical protein